MTSWFYLVARAPENELTVSSRPALLLPKSSASIVRREKKVLVQMCVLVLAFVVCWLPFWIFFAVLSACLRMQVRLIAKKRRREA